MREVAINDRWPLLLPDHRADRHQWPWWEATRLACMYHYLGEHAGHHVVYDIGAEEGDLPALWSSWENDVALFEPNDMVWPNIRAIWDANHLPPPLATFSGFAANTTSTDSLGHIHETWPTSADGPAIGDHGFCNLAERPDIARITIDEFAVAVEPPDAITIDVEGAEFEVLAGAHETLMRWRPLVWCSVHPAFMDAMYRREPDDLHRYMTDRGYERTYLGTDHEEHWFYWPRERELFVQ